MKRSAGILLHPTSFPGRFGIGDLGENSYKFVDFLAESKQNLWQILPLNPVSFLGSPYQSFSAFAGNHLLISLEKLVEKNILAKEELENIPVFSSKKIAWNEVIKFKNIILRKAFKKFSTNAEGYQEFLDENIFWLEDYATFMTLKKFFNGRPWYEWDSSIKQRDKDILKGFKNNYREEIEYQYFLQYEFYTEWKSLKKYANSRKISIIGDIPIFVSEDSSDAWVYPKYFELDKEGRTTKVAGVPPDYFSKTGQRWGNPLYRWDEMEKDDYSWWRARISNLLKLVDYIRIDHFRGFEAYYEIPAENETALQGTWKKGPGEHFFSTIKSYLGELPLIAEDLGLITLDVINLRDKFQLPGMKVLQFIKEERIENNAYPQNLIYYTGTHDNDTFLGWYNNTTKMNSKVSKEFVWNIVETLYMSKAKWVITPLQDVLALSSEARMNTPGTIEGNWDFRYLPDDLRDDIARRLSDFSVNYNRFER